MKLGLQGWTAAAELVDCRQVNLSRQDMQQADGVTPPLQVLHLAQKEASAKASWLHVLN